MEGAFQGAHTIHHAQMTMNTPSPLWPLAENLWLLAYPLKMMGADLRRNVTLIRLASGKLVIHSSAPFSPLDVSAIRNLGEPGWIVDGILRHDTFARQAREAFPDITYLGPDGFAEVVGFCTFPVTPAPAEWEHELLTLELAGAPKARDIAMLHVPSRTLILTELLFNFSSREPAITRFLLRLAVGSQYGPGVPRPIRFGIEDKEAFQASITTLLSWDFDRVIVGHGDVIETQGKEKVRQALQKADLLPSQS